MLRARIAPHFLSTVKRYPLCFLPLYNRSIRTTICNVITVAQADGSGSYDSDDDEEPNINEVDPEHIQTIHNLNKLFYYDYTITYQDLKDLIVGTFKKLYRIQLEVRERRVCFVIYPEIRSENDLEYKKEMENFAAILTDYAMKEFLYNELKKVDIFKKDIIVIPLNFDLQQN